MLLQHNLEELPTNIGYEIASNTVYLLPFSRYISF